MTVDGAMSHGERRGGRSRPRGRVSLYAVAFVLMLAAGGVLAMAARTFLESRSLLWVSVGLSAASILIAVLSLVLPRRR